ncbi:DUF1707 SHOCT-like domain-containing protein [Spirillospora sp. CA-294931]|uniref:DUF1707 SHOCT-like domain-containing protein n=1 Tax=Spirillospora sp. CA-294931 TaxID=3240042 RepID=UPI003D8BA7A6
MSVEQRPAAPRVSDHDRDEVLVRLHTAYAEGRLDDAELDSGIDLVLASRTWAELDRVAAEVPAPYEEPAPGGSGRFQLAFKNRVRRTGRWRVPEKHTAVIYKGGCLLDLRTAELTGPLTVLRIIAYKSEVEIIVPPGVRVVADGMGVSTDLRAVPSRQAPVVHVKGLAYKGSIEAKNHQPLP